MVFLKNTGESSTMEPRRPFSPLEDGLADEELDFITNYDIKYRMGRNV